MTDNNETLHPGRILLTQAMEPLGISRNQLARDIDVPVGRISDITNGKRGVTADTALRLGRYFGTGPELWLRLQAEYDLYVACKTTWPAVESRVRTLAAQPQAAAAAPAAAQVETVVDAPIEAPIAAPREAPPEMPAAPPVLSPVITPEELPTDDVPMAEEIGQEPETPPEASLEIEPESPLESQSNEIDAVSDSNANQDADQDYAGAVPDQELAIPDSRDAQTAETDSEEEPLDLSQALIVDPVPEDEDPIPESNSLDPLFETGLGDDAEEDLGIPPAPDQSKVFMSG
jgi:addiction module HigA family antidote